MAPSTRLEYFIKWPRGLGCHVITKLIFVAFNEGAEISVSIYDGANRASPFKIQPLSVLKIAAIVYKDRYW